MRSDSCRWSFTCAKPLAAPMRAAAGTLLSGCALHFEMYGITLLDTHIRLFMHLSVHEGTAEHHCCRLRKAVAVLASVTICIGTRC